MAKTDIFRNIKYFITAMLSGKFVMFMIISISIASFSLPTAIAFYWIIINGFSVVQNYVIKKILAKEQKDPKVIDIKHKEKKDNTKKKKKEVKYNL